MFVEVIANKAVSFSETQCIHNTYIVLLRHSGRKLQR